MFKIKTPILFLFPLLYQVKYFCWSSLQHIGYDIIKINNAKVSGKARFELSETQSGQQKRASEKALNLNGGTDEAHCVCLRISKI